MRRWVCLFALLCPSVALAQPVFYDDFDGNALLPHWHQPPPSWWQYNVSNSMLNVTGLLFPSDPKIPANYADMYATYAPQTDFSMDVRMGWDGDSGEFYRLEVNAQTSIGQYIATFGYRHLEGSAPVIIAGIGGGPSVTAPPPPPGIHQFTITRVGAEVAFFLDGQPFGVLTDTFRLPAARVHFSFDTPYPGQMFPMHVDRVQVVPAPAPVTAGALLALGWACRRRRRVTV